MTSFDRRTAPHFSQPVRQILTMLLIVALVAVGAWFAFPRVEGVLLTSPWLNGAIFGVFLVGIFACFWQVTALVRAVDWIEAFASGRAGSDIPPPPSLLVPLAAILRQKGARRSISLPSARSVLDTVATRMDEVRDITRYISNLLIFLGLLGTFYGLAITVPAVVDTIRSLAPQPGEESVAVFDRLMTGLEGQLGGMGTAFSSSLLGLTGSLVIGLLDLFAGHGQNRFYRELEEWLSSITRIGPAAGEGDGGTEAVAGAALAQMAEQMESLREMFVQSDVSRALVDERLGELARSLDRLVRRLDAEADASALLVRIADGQDRMAAALGGAGAPDGAGGSDAENRMRLRSIDVQLLRILEEMSVGRQESLADLRADLAQLTRAVRQLGAEAAEGGRRRG